MSVEFRVEPIANRMMDTYHIFLFGEKYCFVSQHLDFGSTIRIILSPHGDFGCDCNGCRVYRAVKRRFNVSLGGDGPSTHSEEMQAVAYNAAGILAISLPAVSYRQHRLRLKFCMDSYKT